jgi:protein gp37
LSDKFQPLFWPDRLSQPSLVKKPARIFVGSMGDLFGDWVPREWIGPVIGQADLNPQHTFIFLTKNPARYREFDPWPDNCWLGVTVTGQADVDEQVPLLLNADAKVRFVSVEPMLGSVDLRNFAIQWLIIGALTGSGAANFNRESGFHLIGWVRELIDQARDARVPVFAKDNIHREPDFGVTSVNYDFTDLLTRAEHPL